jgi:hypothetical protein
MKKKGHPPAVARAVWSGRCWLRARCRFRAEGALPVLVLSSTLLATGIYLTRILAVVICGSGSTCVSVLSSFGTLDPLPSPPLPGFNLAPVATC